MTAALLGGLHDDVAAIELDRLAAPRRLYRKFRALIHLHARAVGELKDGSRAGVGADNVLVRHGCARLERTSRQPIKSAGYRDHGRPWAGRRERRVHLVTAEI